MSFDIMRNIWHFVINHSFVFDSLWPQWTIPARILCLWDFPGENTGVGGQFPTPVDPPHPGIRGSTHISCVSCIRVDSFTLNHVGNPFDSTIFFYFLNCLQLTCTPFLSRKFHLLFHKNSLVDNILDQTIRTFAHYIPDAILSTLLFS